jgi:hypothetical protein
MGLCPVQAGAGEIASIAARCDPGSYPHYESDDRTWVGPGLWANRLQDWQVKDGRLECVGPGPARAPHPVFPRAV